MVAPLKILGARGYGDLALRATELNIGGASLALDAPDAGGGGRFTPNVRRIRQIPGAIQSRHRSRDRATSE